jgi:hypothetical protein
MIHGEKSFTKGNNMRAPSMEVYLKWIVDAWEQLPTELIINSFKGCALTIALDGSEDDLIHCFKPNGSIPNGLQLLQQARSQQLKDSNALVDLIEAIDLEEDNKNAYESDVSIDFEV